MDSKTTLGVGVRPLQGGGGIFKSAAVAVLRLERRLLTTGEITKIALEKALINCQGRTPEATMASALYTDVKRKLGSSVFTRPQEGLFGLKEWEDEGFVPEPVPTAGPLLAPLAAEPAPKRLRGASTRVIKKPERFADDDHEDEDEHTARSTPSPLLWAEHHSRMVGSSPEEPLSLMRPQRCSDAEVTSPNAELLAVHKDPASCPPGHSSTQDVHVQCYSEQDPVALSSAIFPQQADVPTLVDQALTGSPDAKLEPWQRPCLELEMPSSEHLSGDLQFFFWTPGAGPLSAAMDIPTLLDPQSPPSTPPVSHRHHADHLGALQEQLQQENPNAAAQSHTLTDSTAGSGSNENFTSGSLDTPSLMQMPLPEGDLSWSPLHNLRGSMPEAQVPGLSFYDPALSHDPLAFLPAKAVLLAESALPAAQGRASETAQQLVPMRSHPGPSRPANPCPFPSTSRRPNAGESPKAVAERLACMEAEVQHLEAQLGKDHPLVGQHYLRLSWAFQKEDPALYAEKTELALFRAWQICKSCFNDEACNVPFNCLLSHIRGTYQESRQGREASTEPLLG